MVENRAADRPRDLEPSKKPFEWVALFFRCLIVGALVSIAAWMLANFLFDTFAGQR
jgi:hypothetical protein